MQPDLAVVFGFDHARRSYKSLGRPLNGVAMRMDWILLGLLKWGDRQGG